jgi:hypothetical protein
MSTHREVLLQALEEGRLLRSRDLDALGVPRIALTRLRKGGEVVKDGPFYRHVNTPEASDLQVLATTYPNGILCLLSAQRFHNLTETPCLYHSLALPRENAFNRAKAPDGMEVSVISWRDSAFYELGIECIDLGGGLSIMVTDRWRTVADMFRPQHMQDPEQANKALAIIASEDGRSGLSRVTSYAIKLGFGERVLNIASAAADVVEVPRGIHGY